MKIIHKIFVLSAMALFISSCEEGDVFTGSPIGTNVQFETLEGTISTSYTAITASQKFPVTITLPQAFAVDVNVEVIAMLPNSNKRARKYFVIKAGETVLNDFMNAPSADTGTILPFNNNLKVYLSAVNSVSSPEVPFGFNGVQYSLTSNVIDMNYGDTAVTAVNANRFGVRFDWPGPYSSLTAPNSVNNLNIRVKRDGGVISVPAGATQPVNGTTTSNARYETVNILATAPDGEYTIEVFANKLETAPVNLPYRFAIRFPDETVQVIEGVLNGLTLGTAATAVPKLKIVKVTTAGVPTYTVTPL